jgi:hypothetical protein
MLDSFNPGFYLGEFGRRKPLDPRQTLARRINVDERAGGGTPGATMQKQAPPGVPPAGGSGAMQLLSYNPSGDGDRPRRMNTTPLAANTPNINGVATEMPPLTPPMPSNSTGPGTPPAGSSTPGRNPFVELDARAQAAKLPQNKNTANLTDMADNLLIKRLDPLRFANPFEPSTKGMSAAAAPAPPPIQDKELTAMRDTTRKTIEELGAERNPYQASRDLKVGVGSRIGNALLGFLGGGLPGVVEGAMGRPQRRREFARVAGENELRGQQQERLFKINKAISEDEGAQREQLSRDLDARMRGEQQAETERANRRREGFEEFDQGYKDRQLEASQRNQELNTIEQLIQQGDISPDIFGGRYRDIIEAFKRKAAAPGSEWRHFDVDPNTGQAYGIKLSPDGAQRVKIAGDQSTPKPRATRSKGAGSRPSDWTTIYGGRKGKQKIGRHNYITGKTEFLPGFGPEDM